MPENKDLLKGLDTRTMLGIIGALAKKLASRLDASGRPSTSYQYDLDLCRLETHLAEIRRRYTTSGNASSNEDHLNH